MKISELKKWVVVDHLRTDAEMAAYLDACLDEDPGDGSLIRAALGDIARAKGMTNLARNTGLTREGLYKALSSSGNPELSTILQSRSRFGHPYPTCRDPLNQRPCVAVPAHLRQPAPSAFQPTSRSI